MLFFNNWLVVELMRNVIAEAQSEDLLLQRALVGVNRARWWGPPPSGPHQKNREHRDCWRQAEWAGQRSCSLRNIRSPFFYLLLTLTFNSLTDFHERLTHQCSSTNFDTYFARVLSIFVVTSNYGMGWHDIWVRKSSLCFRLNYELFSIPLLFRQLEFLGADTSYSKDGVKYFKV